MNEKQKNQIEEKINNEVEETTKKITKYKELSHVDVENIVKEIDTIEDVKVNIVFEPPWTKDMMSEEAKLELGML